MGLIIGLVTFLLGFVVGGLMAFQYSRKKIKSNPPITEHHIRELYRQTIGKKLSHAQARQIMNSINRQK